MTQEDRLKRWRLILGGDAGGRDRRIAHRPRAGDGPRARCPLRTPRRRAAEGGPGRIVAACGPMARRHPRILPHLGGACDATGCDGSSGAAAIVLEPEMLETVEPDVHLVADLLSLAGAMKGKSKETARIVVRKCVEEVQRRLAEPTRQAITGHSIAPFGIDAPSIGRSTGTARCAPISATISRSIKRWSRRRA